MPVAFAADTLRRGTWADGKPLTSEDREKLIQSYLPLPRHEGSTANIRHSPRFCRQSLDANRSLNSRRPQGTRILLQTPTKLLHSVLHQGLFFLIQLAFSVYMHFRQMYHTILDRIFAILYYHHRTPELIRRDVKALGKLPTHLSVILEFHTDGTGSDRETEELSKLCGEVAEIAAWCTCTGITMLSIYECSGILKSHTPYLHQVLEHTFRAYFPPDMISPVELRAPNRPTFLPPNSPITAGGLPPLQLLLLSASDGRDTLIDLTKTLAEMSQKGKIMATDISADLIDAEITESSCGEPDLLVIMSPSSYKLHGYSFFRGLKKGKDGASGAQSPTKRAANGSVMCHINAGGELCLQGYPPWQLKLTEIFYVQDNQGAGYQVFLRALHRYAKAQMRFGR